MTRIPKRRQTRIRLFSISLIVAGSVMLALSHGIYNHILVFLWLLSLLCFVLSAGHKLPNFHRLRWSFKPVHVLIIGVIVLPVMVRLLNYTPTRMHGDDLLTAYFSLDYHPRTTNFFSGIPDKDVWVSSFPTVYFLFQKMFLRMFGATLLTVKLSVIPYILMVTLLLFAVTATLTNIPTAVAAVWLYAFSAFSIYLETLGLHFISSTAVFLLFFFFLIRGLKDHSPQTFALTGIFASFCYLSYTSSYIAFPILVLSVILAALRSRPIPIIRLLAWALIGFALGIAPFVTYAATNRNYFVERIDQVSLVNGQWSSFKDKTKTIGDVATVIRDNFVLSARSLVYDDIGGHGGYTFNKQAFFNRESLLFFVVGSALALILGFTESSWWIILITIFISFVSGMVLTIPPPAFHRLSLTLPFIAIVSALPVYMVTRTKRPHPLGIGFLIGCLIVYAATNLSYVKPAIDAERLIADTAVIVYVNQTFPHRNVHIAAFPSFALGKQWVFFPDTDMLSIDTKFHSDYLDHFHADEPYVYVITLPSEFRAKFIKIDPNGTYIPFSEKYGLFVN